MRHTSPSRPNMKKEIEECALRYLNYEQVKDELQRPRGLIQPLEILEQKWEHLTMDFVTGLPKTHRGNDMVWVVVDRLTKSASFLSLKIITSMDGMAWLYVKEKVRIHRIPVFITSH